ncbi:MAG: response regulator [Desulfobacteraceae bacterium]|nr:response regulator [Desulfobacteraceae bacterium]
MNEKNNGNAILFVDDEKSVLNSLKRLLRKEDYKILTATSGKEGLDILNSNEIQVVISDQRMPEMDGTEFLAEVKKEYPDIIRIILSGYTDVDVVIDTINEDNIYKFFHKPWNDQSLILEIRQAFEHYKLVQDNTRLSFQNKALVLYHAILVNIPLPVIGISAEKTIAIYNNKASQMHLDGIDIQIGSKISDTLPDKIVTLINNSLENKNPETIEYSEQNKESYNVSCTPFTGHFSDKGAVLSFMPV